jgi:hypothetical protein
MRVSVEKLAAHQDRAAIVWLSPNTPQFETGGLSQSRKFWSSSSHRRVKNFDDGGPIQPDLINLAALNTRRSLHVNNHPSGKM